MTLNGFMFWVVVIAAAIWLAVNKPFQKPPTHRYPLVPTNRRSWLARLLQKILDFFDGP